MKLKVRQDYYRRVRKVLESSLNRENTVTAINTWEVQLRDTLQVSWIGLSMSWKLWIGKLGSWWPWTCIAPTGRLAQTVCDLGRGEKRIDVSGWCGENGGTQFVGLPGKKQRSIQMGVRSLSKRIMETETERQWSWMDGVTNHYTGSICQELKRKA